MDKFNGGNSQSIKRVAVFFVGNRLMLDDGLGPFVMDDFRARYVAPSEVELFEVGVLGLDMIEQVKIFDYIIAVDAVDGTQETPGTILRYSPDDLRQRGFGSVSLHELSLRDLFDAALLLGYEAQGLCLGMQVENPQPAYPVVGLTSAVHDALPLLSDVLAGELARLGFECRKRDAAT